MVLLDLTNRGLAVLPSIPGNVTRLLCSDNELTALPDLPAGLFILYCSNNQLRALPKLPTGLAGLSCNNNQLTALPDLPAELDYFRCDNNPFPRELQVILDKYRYNIRQLIVSVNHYNSENRRRANLRQAGRIYRSIKNIGRNMPNNVMGIVGNYAAHKPSYGLNQTLRNLKNKHNSYGPWRQRKSRKQKRRR